MSRTVFITGATGNIGGELLLKILAKEPGTRVIALIRGESSVAARTRLIQTLLTLSPDFAVTSFDQRVQVLCGDITGHQLGLSDTAFERLACGITHIVHAAATIQFTLPLECARQVNFVGTVNVMHLAERAAQFGKLKNVAYISTAYVCGDRDGLIAEDDSVQPSHFSNTYEQTKFEAEQYVRTLMPRLPITILRPSIVVGDALIGRTLTFNVLYSPLRLIYKGMIRALACDPTTPLDCVPLDFIADAIRHIALHTDSAGKTYHLAAGGEQAPLVGDVVRDFIGYLKQHSIGSPAVANLLSHHNRKEPAVSSRTLQLMSVFDPYLKVKRSFSIANTLAALEGSGINLPSFDSYFDKLMDYCFAVDWGKALRLAA